MQSTISPSPPGKFRSALAISALLLVAAAIVGGTWIYASVRIADNRAATLKASLAPLLPQGQYDNEPFKDRIDVLTRSGDVLPVYRARRGGQPVSAVLSIVTPDAYVGPIRLLVGIAADGRVLGVRVIEQHETVGIGDAITGSAWLNSFRGQSLRPSEETAWGLKQNGGSFDAIAGATVSSRAVVNGVRQALEYFASHQDVIFAPPAE